MVTLDVFIQPSDGTLMERFRQILQSLSPRSEVKILTFVCAEDIINELQNEIKQIIHNNGTFKIIIGISRNVYPTKETLTKLKEIIGSENIFLYHYTEGAFHPKFYFIKNGNGPSTIIVGSSNFTKPGFSTNFETNAIITCPFLEDYFLVKSESSLNRIEQSRHSVCLDEILGELDFWPPPLQQPAVDDSSDSKIPMDQLMAILKIFTDSGGDGDPSMKNPKQRLAGYRAALTRGLKIDDAMYEDLCAMFGVDSTKDRAIRRRNGIRLRYINQT